MDDCSRFPGWIRVTRRDNVKHAQIHVGCVQPRRVNQARTLKRPFLNRPFDRDIVRSSGGEQEGILLPGNLSLAVDTPNRTVFGHEPFHHRDQRHRCVGAEQA